MVPPVSVAGGFTATAGGLPLPDQWWRSFNDPILNGLVAEALTNNFDLQAAMGSAAQARATARVEAAALVPSVQGSGAPDGRGGSRKSRARTFPPRTSTNSSPHHAGDELRARARGELRAGFVGPRAVVARRGGLRREGVAEEVQTAALTLSASVADTWYQLVEQNAQIDLLEAQLALNAKVTTLVTTRFKQGQVGSLDVFQQRQLEESRRGDIALAKAQAAILQHQLAILLGQPPTRTVAKRVAELPSPGRASRDRDSGGARAAAARRAAGLLRYAGGGPPCRTAVADRFPRISLTAGVERRCRVRARSA